MEQIRNMFLSKYKLECISAINIEMLQLLYKYYDTIIFENQISNLMSNKKESISFKIGRSKQIAGEYIYKPKFHIIKISSILISNLFQNNEKVLKCNGKLVKDKLDVLMSVFEHELIHLYCKLIGVYDNNKNLSAKTRSHGKIFQYYAYTYFKHTDFRHNLNDGDVFTHISKSNLSIDQSVSFMYKNTKITGKIIKLNPKTTKIFTGNNIYYVPYSKLLLLF